MKVSKKKQYKFDIRELIPLGSAFFALFTDLMIPNHIDAKNRELKDFTYFILILIVILFLYIALSFFSERIRGKYTEQSWLIGGVILFLGVLNILTVKVLLFPQVYLPSLNRVLHVFVTDYAFLAKNLFSSFLLLMEGMAMGTVIGVITGVLVGWSKRWNYWIFPLIRFLGPIPSSTWIPLALVVFSQASGAAVFLIAFAVWFQMAIMTSSGIQEVKKSYYEVASTLGATNHQILFKVAIPSALPIMFLGLFNSTCSAFVALMSAEMLGCSLGIGWYINWQKKMLAYPNVYAGILIIAVFCFLILNLEMKSRGKLLSWQKGIIKW